jgi:hypothetical protein
MGEVLEKWEWSLSGEGVCPQALRPLPLHPPVVGLLLWLKPPAYPLPNSHHRGSTTFLFKKLLLMENSSPYLI